MPNSALLLARMEGVRSTELEKLTTGLARGDDLAWAQFHREYGPRIFRQLLATTRGDHDLASEALQQTYLRVARHARPCEVEAMFLGWLRVVARTALSDCRRRRQSFWGLLRRRSDDACVVDDPADDEALQGALDVAMGRLDPADRALLEAKYFSGRTVRAMADQLSATPKAVESRLTRARADLRREVLAALSRHE